MGSREKLNPSQEGLNIESLIEALFYRDEFLSIASHELKTPLTSLKLHAQVFQRSLKKNGGTFSREDVERLINQVNDQTNRMTKLIDNMLFLTRVRSGKLTFVKDHFNFSQMLFESIEQCDSNLIKLKASKDVYFYGDKESLEWATSSILNNALRYGKGLPVEVKLVVRKASLLVSFTDQGIGIKKEDHKRIFHRFQRAVPASEISGLGLGLYISREIALAHGGTISVISEVDKGSTFSMTLSREKI